MCKERVSVLTDDDDDEQEEVGNLARGDGDGEQ